MKNLLRNLTLAALVAAPAFYASADLTLTQKYWGQSATIGDAWGGPSNPGMTARFATGKDGKFYTIDMAQKAIVSFEAPASTDGTITEVPTPTVVKTFELAEGTVVAGSSLSIDSKGNFVFNFNFVQKAPDLRPSQAWGVYNPTADKLSYYVLPANECVADRIDHMGRIVGDVTSAEGGYGYVFCETVAYPIVYHFTGNGTEMTKITCAPLADGLAIEGLQFKNLGWAQPSSEDVSTIAANPTQTYFATQKYTTVVTVADGEITTVAPGKSIGNTGNPGFDTFTLGGKRYFVRSYNNKPGLVAGWGAPKPGEESFSPLTWGANWMVLNFCVFDEDGNIVGEWQESNWAKSASGYASITAEKVDENTVNIYAYISANKADGSQCVMCTLTNKEGGETPDVPTPEEPTKHVLKGSGTAADPYLIATAEDLCAAHLYIPQEVAGDVVYFKQTANIDMAGITDWQALNGWYGSYAGQLYYDGNNHVIYNFAPVDGAEVRDKEGEEGVVDYDNPNFGHYYDTSIFGVLRGTVKNLGVIDANIEEVNNFDGAGIISTYSGQGGVDATIENVFVTGTVKGLKRVGGMLAHAGGANTLKNVYAVVEIAGPAGKTAGIIGNLNDKTMDLEGGYVLANPIEGTINLIAGGSGTVKVPSYSFEVYGDGAIAATTVTVEGKDDIWSSENLDGLSIAGLQAGQKDNFGDKKMLGGYPTFNWMTNAQLLGLTISGNGTSDAPYLISSADELGDAYKLIEPSKVIYYNQTADIDMDGVTDYHAINGFNGNYTAAVVYDGKNHVIRNFAPDSKAVVDAENSVDYYCNSVFGVLAGSVKNLGIIDAEAVNTDSQGAAILAVYGGHGSAPAGFQAATIDNVFVTGKAESDTYVGGMIGTTGNDVKISNSYVVADVTGDVEVAGLVSRAVNPITLENVYTAGTVSGGALVVKQRDGRTGASVKATDVYALNTGSDITVTEGVTVTGTITKATLADAKATIQGWAAFNEKKEMAGYPTLNWMTEDQISGVEDVIVDEIGVDENAPVEYFNLQGVRVENPANGLYIKRQGKTVTKVVIR